MFLNQFNYSPRPVFQGYQAGTPWLLDTNRAFLESHRAPEYILADVMLIDGRFPAMEDDEAFKAVLRNYVPVLQERNYVLMRRNKETHLASADDFAPLLERKAAFGEWVTMDGTKTKWQLLSLDIQPSGIGRLLTFLYKPPILHLETEMANGKVRRHRIDMLMVEQGFIVNPLIESGKDMPKCYTGGTLPRLTAFRLVIDSHADSYFKRHIGIDLTGTDALIPEQDVHGNPG